MRKLTRQALANVARRLLHTNDTPERTALAFALGTGVGFSPFLFCHWGLALLLSIILRLNKVAVFAGTLVNNPWTYVPILVGGTQLGALMLGRGWILEQIPRPEIAFSLHAALLFLGSLKPLAFPFFVGNMTLSILSFMVAYSLSLRFIRHRRAHHHRTAEAGPGHPPVVASSQVVGAGDRAAYPPPPPAV